MSIDPKKSLCHTCKYGVSMLQESEVHLRGNFPPQEDAEEEVSFEIGGQEEHFHVETKACSICFYSPPGVKINSPVILPSIVKECSRYKNEDLGSK